MYLNQLFTAGDFFCTIGVQACIPEQDISQGLSRHLQGDWGDLCAEDKKQNNLALKHGGRLFSAYHSSAGVKFWIITEADRSATTILLPEEY